MRGGGRGIRIVGRLVPHRSIYRTIARVRRGGTGAAETGAVTAPLLPSGPIRRRGGRAGAGVFNLWRHPLKTGAARPGGTRSYELRGWGGPGTLVALPARAPAARMMDRAVDG